MISVQSPSKLKAKYFLYLFRGFNRDAHSWGIIGGNDIERSELSDSESLETRPNPEGHVIVHSLSKSVVVC